MNLGYVLLYLTIGTIFGGYGSLYLKKGSSKLTFNIKKWKDNLQLVIGFFLYGISTITYLIMLQYGELSVIYPLTSVSYIFISFLSIYYLNEKMTKNKWIGIILIIIGSFLVVR
jgi:uncharacterized membrane protein